MKAAKSVRLFLFRYVDQALMAAVLPRYRAALEGSLKRPWLVLGVGYAVLAAESASWFRSWAASSSRRPSAISCWWISSRLRPIR